MVQKRIALLGGTFDPIHLGHTGIASAAARHLHAERVVFVPAKRSPLKIVSPQASDRDRLAMVEIAVSSYDNFEPSDCELKKPAPSLTLHTVRQFQDRYGPQTSIYWLLGADSLGDLVHWYKITELIDRCSLSVMHRAGCALPNFARFEALWGRERVEKLEQSVIETPLIDISSTEVRRRLAAREDVGDLLDPGVLDYIRRHNLYQSLSS